MEKKEAVKRLKIIGYEDELIDTIIAETDENELDKLVPECEMAHQANSISPPPKPYKNI